MFSTRFFFDDNAGEGGGAAAAVVDNAQATQQQSPQDQTQVLTPELQKELEELRTFKKSVAEREPEKTPEQIAKEAEIAQADFRKFAVENDIMKNDDFSQYETVKSRQDRDLVYEHWLASWKEENPDVAPENIEDQSKLDFEAEYGLNTSNEKKAARAIAKLAKEASELRNPIESKYNTAKTRYEQENQIRKTYPAFESYINGKVSEQLKDKITVFEKDIDGEKIPLEIELTADDKKQIMEEVNKELLNPVNYINFTEKTKDGKNELLDKLVAKETKYLINEKKQQALLEKASETFIGIGLRKGSNVGAEQPFALVGSKDVPAKVIPMSAQQAVAESQKQVRQKMGR